MARVASDILPQREGTSISDNRLLFTLSRFSMGSINHRMLPFFRSQPPSNAQTAVMAEDACGTPMIAAKLHKDRASNARFVVGSRIECSGSSRADHPQGQKPLAVAYIRCNECQAAARNVLHLHKGPYPIGGQVMLDPPAGLL